jgi:type I restriction enzyme R subunit
MSFNELNAVEHFIIQKLSGKNLNAADPTSSVVKDDEAVYGSSPWRYRSAAQLARALRQVEWHRRAD